MSSKARRVSGRQGRTNGDTENMREHEMAREDMKEQSSAFEAASSRNARRAVEEEPHVVEAHGAVRVVGRVGLGLEERFDVAVRRARQRREAREQVAVTQHALEAGGGGDGEGVGEGGG